MRKEKKENEEIVLTRNKFEQLARASENTKEIVKESYSDKLRSPKWQRKRLEILQRDDFTCKTCGDTETTLNVHHIEYGKGDPWDVENDKLITLCEHCHLEVENFKHLKDDPIFNCDGKFDFKNSKIYKAAGFSDGARIMFVPIGESFGMSIFNADNVFITGYYFNHSRLKEIVKFISKINHNKWQKDLLTQQF